MHIPDSVLSPITCASAGVVMAPVWSIAARRVRRTLGTRQMPLLALGAAFCFTIMMFNIPALGGTTAHPVAGTLLAVMLGPWAACIGISAALLIQALFFGDGGILAYGANCFTMAFVLPFVGYAVYRLLSTFSGRARDPLCAAIGAFVGINAAALAVAVLLGIQPALFHEANGHALYFPFDLRITVPAMLGTHLLIAGPAEAVVTALVVRYLGTLGISVYGISDAVTSFIDSTTAPGGVRLGKAAPRLPLKLGEYSIAPTRRLWIGLLLLIALTPLGLLATGEAWAEWDAKGVAEQTVRQFGSGRGYTPKGFEAAEAHGYHGLPGLQAYAAGDGRNWLGYIGAALLGAGALASLVFVGGQVLLRDKPAEVDVGVVEDATPLELRSHGALPRWLSTPPDRSLPTAIPKKRQNRYVERTLAELAAAAAAGLQSDRWAQRGGLLQGIDARAKVLTLLLLVLVTTSVHRLPVLVALYGLGLALGLASRLPLGLMLRRVWLAVPVFVAAMAVPLALTAVTPGRELFTIVASPHMAVSRPGLVLAGMLTLRVATAVTFALILTWTTRWNDLLQALRALFVPRAFLTVLAMTYRYLAVTLQTASDAFTARRSRTVGPSSNLEGRQFIGSSIGALFGKSLAVAEEVHAAMVSRGFRGEVRTLAHPRWRIADTVAAVVLCSAVAVAWAHR